MLQIESNVPPPESHARLRYPFADMYVGDSFLIEDPSMVKNARSAAWMYSKRHGWKFSCRKVEGGWRVWRTA
ncbi:hypothetical protein [Gemmatimonas sp.]|jgi:hypothetical protein|uniref:hypothetical protein n=1 Tax=Gemmatimonas sp. TaxID=1962908 RepID=UPI003341DA90